MASRESKSSNNHTYDGTLYTTTTANFLLLQGGHTALAGTAGLNNINFIGYDEVGPSRLVRQSRVNLEYDVAETPVDTNILAVTNAAEPPNILIGTGFADSTSPNSDKSGYPIGFTASQVYSNPNAGLVVNRFINFSKPIDPQEVIQIIKLLDVDDPSTTKFSTLSTDNRKIAMDEFLSDVLNLLLTDSYQKITTDTLKKYTDPSAETITPLPLQASEINIDRGGDAINLDKDLNTVNIRLEQLKTTDPLYAGFKDLKDKLLIRKQLIPGFLVLLKKDADKVAILGGVQDNIDAGTHFGDFAILFTAGFNALAENWKTIKKEKNTSGTKKAKSATATGKAAATVVTPDLAGLEREQESVKVGNQIVKLPFKNTNTFPGTHEDFNKSLSILDILREELVDAKIDTTINVRAESDATTTSTVDACHAALKKLSPEQLAQLGAALAAKFKEAKNELLKAYQELKKIESSADFNLSSSLTGLPKLWPPNLANLNFDFPIIDVSQQIRNAAIGIEAAAALTGKQIVNAAKAAKNLFKKPDLGSINLTLPTINFKDIFKNVYGSSNMALNADVCQTLNDIKKVVEKTQDTKATIERLKASTSSTLNRYQDTLESIKKKSDTLSSIQDLSTTITGLQGASSSSSFSAENITAQINQATLTAKQKTNDTVLTATQTASNITAGPNSGKVSI